MRFWWTGWDDFFPWVICVACSCGVEGGGGPFYVADCYTVAGAGCVADTGAVNSDADADAGCVTNFGAVVGAESGTLTAGVGAIVDSSAESGVGAVVDFGAESGAGSGPYSLGRRGQVFLKVPICIHMPHFFLTPDLFTNITFLSFFFNSNERNHNLPASLSIVERLSTQNPKSQFSLSAFCPDFFFSTRFHVLCPNSLST